MKSIFQDKFLRSQVAMRGGTLLHCRKRGQKQKGQIQVQRTFDRRTGELNGSLSGSARWFTLPLTGCGKRSILAANRPY
jgi:hypothetical protein